VLIEVQQAGPCVVAGRKQFLRDPRHHRSPAAHNQGRNRPDAQGAAAAQIHLAVRFERDQCAIEPARVDGTGPGDPALEHILAVEMRALAIGRRRRVHDRGLLCLVQPVEVRHRGIEREECIERQRLRLAIEHQRPIAAQANPVGVTDRRNRPQPIQRASEHDDQQARITALGPRQPWHLAPCEQRTGAQQSFATVGQMGMESHAHLL
jgi:hypothetical protein